MRQDTKVGAAVTLKLRYDGKYDFLPVESARQWTILSHFIDAHGQDRFKGSFGLKGLIEIGAIKLQGAKS